ncbi:hypothetical protein FJY94_02315 [Candidatus Kaiserbacteria bacterium]|nr:hypothetical protein [Candidatus Kaiserbacteria bacterium]
MRRIILGLILIAGASGAIGVGATGAYFSDTEASTGNTFVAGAIDLTVDNESYYNGNKCAEVTAGIWQWQGPAAYPVPGTPCVTSFNATDLATGRLFFSFDDLKPDDEGEDTISLHVSTNDAYACMDMTLTSNDDKSSTDPELASPDVQEDVNNTWDGELAQNIQMFWWADDGDNVYEVGENTISGGVKNLMDLASTTQSGAFSVALADPTHNVWNPNAPGPIPGNQTVYIAKNWCFGTLTPAPIAQDNLGHTGTNGPQARGSGFTCDGSALGNRTQTDGVTIDIAFRAVQSRNNSGFSCDGTNPRLAKITVVKQIINDNGGNNVVADFQLFVDNGIVTTPVTSSIGTNVVAGNYQVSETGVPGYVGSYGGDCDSSGFVTLAPGDDKTCILTNNDLPANITLIKVATGTLPLANPSTFVMRVDGTVVPNTTSIAVTSNSMHSITEDPKAGYTFLSLTGAGCPANLGTPFSLNEGQAITCTITNQKNPI